MRHRSKTKILSRTSPARRALLRDLATSLVLYGKIRTTSAKAKTLRPYIERLVTYAKHGTLAHRRRITRSLRTEVAVRKLMDEVAPKYKSRAGGYTRILKIGARQGDGAEIAQIEFC